MIHLRRVGDTLVAWRTLLRDDTAISSEATQRLDEYARSPGRWRVDVKGGPLTIRGPFASAAEQEIVTVLARTVPGLLSRAYKADRRR